jgi:hypothetical protein
MKVYTVALYLSINSVGAGAFDVRLVGLLHLILLSASAPQQCHVSAVLL